MVARACVECGVTPLGVEETCRVCGGLVPSRAWRDDAGGETVALPSGLLGPRADDAACAPGGIAAGDLLRVDFGPGKYMMELRRGEEVALGRDADLCPHAGFLDRFEDVSRRHVTLRLDAEGQAFVRDEYSTNWTVRNGVRITPGAEHRLRDGDRLRLGGSLSGLVRLVAVPASLPDPHTRRG
jgi:FHA domain-containing protein